MQDLKEYGWLSTGTKTSGAATCKMVDSSTVASHLEFSSSYETRSLYDIFLPLCLHRFVMQTLKSPPLWMVMYVATSFFILFLLCGNIALLPSSVLKGLSHQIDLTFDFMYTVQHEQQEVSAEKWSNPCWPTRSKGKFTKYTPLTLSMQPSFSIIGRNTFILIQNLSSS